MASLSPRAGDSDDWRANVDAVAGQSGEPGAGAFRGATEDAGEASRIELGFPMDMYAKDFVRAIAYVGLRDKIIV